MYNNAQQLFASKKRVVSRDFIIKEGVYERRLKLQRGIILFSSAVFYGKTQHVRHIYSMALCPAVIHVVNAYLIYRLFIFFFTLHHHSVNMVLFSFSHSSGLRYYIFSLEELHQTGSMLRVILLHF